MFLSKFIFSYAWLTLSFSDQRETQQVYNNKERELIEQNAKNDGNAFDNIVITSDNVILANEKLDEALKSLRALQCPFENQTPFTVLGQGCDGVNQDCDSDELVDECDEDKVPPTIILKHPPPTKPFQSVLQATSFLNDNIQVSDDCAAILTTAIALASEPDCTNCIFSVTATDQRCKDDASAPAAKSVKSFSLNVDSVAPAITCGFFFPQDPFHVIGGFDPCQGLSPPFPPAGDFLHIDRNCFGKDLIDVKFWYQIEVSNSARQSSSLNHIVMKIMPTFMCIILSSPHSHY